MPSVTKIIGDGIITINSLLQCNGTVDLTNAAIQIANSSIYDGTFKLLTASSITTNLPTGPTINTVYYSQIWELQSSGAELYVKVRRV